MLRVLEYGVRTQETVQFQLMLFAGDDYQSDNCRRYVSWHRSCVEYQ